MFMISSFLSVELKLFNLLDICIMMIFNNFKVSFSRTFAFADMKIL